MDVDCGVRGTRGQAMGCGGICWCGMIEWLPVLAILMIQFSPAATTEILRLRAKRQDATVLFRLSVLRQGCLGRAYAMGFDADQHPDDRRFDCNGIPVVIQVAHLNELENVVIDYSEDMMGGGFRFSNPQAVQSCGCGNSFAIAA
jgi:iron-sulfur cluster assembly protein